MFSSFMCDLKKRSTAFELRLDLGFSPFHDRFIEAQPGHHVGSHFMAFGMFRGDVAAFPGQTVGGMNNRDLIIMILMAGGIMMSAYNGDQMWWEVPVFGDAPPYCHMVDAQHQALRLASCLALTCGERHRDCVLHREIAIQEQCANVMQQ